MFNLFLGIILFIGLIVFMIFSGGLSKLYGYAITNNYVVGV